MMKRVDNLGIWVISCHDCYRPLCI